LQAKLLRFLEDGSFSRVGGTLELRVDVRLIAATNRDIIEAIGEGLFREDLYHRLNVVQFRPPPLRERGDDVLVLARHFLKHFGVGLNKSLSGFGEGAERLLREHHWPGNVRELRNVVERAVILEGAGEIQAATLPDFQLERRLKKAGGEGEVVPVVPAGNFSLEEALERYEKELIQRTLDQTHNNLAKAADQLRITRHALRYRVNRLNLRAGGSEEGDEQSGRGEAGRG
jgi:DNA-binding NtrC family response regulator